MTPFSDINALIIDMDGVLWHGKNPLPGLNAFFDTLREKRLPFILATNNASLTAAQYIDKLDAMGVTVSSDEIITSGIATARYLADNYPPESTRIFVLGESGATQPLQDLGFMLCDLYQIKNSSPEGADIVVCGLDRSLSWDKLSTATLNINAGALFIGTNGDTTLPTERGVTQGNGAILGALEIATGIKPTLIGKPEPIMYQQAMAMLGAKPEHTIAIGDRLNTDILGAVNAGIRSVMVLTGISSEADLNNIDYRPTWIMSDIQELTQAIRELA
jgi:HAD superfamily hydrolase (TIGR01457 family)